MDRSFTSWLHIISLTLTHGDDCKFINLSFLMHTTTEDTTAQKNNQEEQSKKIKNDDTTQTI